MKVKELKENIRSLVRKKLSEATIDVPNPATETPQTKKSKIDMARRVTGDKTIGTEKNPAEFIEEDNIDEADYFDPDDEVREGVDDVDYGDSDFKDYDSIYERMQKLLKYKG
jgi:hypothetical protein